MKFKKTSFKPNVQKLLAKKNIDIPIKGDNGEIISKYFPKTSKRLLSIQKRPNNYFQNNTDNESLSFWSRLKQYLGFSQKRLYSNLNTPSSGTGYFANKIGSAQKDQHLQGNNDLLMSNWVEKQPEDDPYYKKNLVDLLGQAGDQLEAKFKELLKLYHPDSTHFPKEYAEARTKELNTARLEAAKRKPEPSDTVSSEEQQYAHEIWYKSNFESDYKFPKYSYDQMHQATHVIDNVIQQSCDAYEKGIDFITLKLADGTPLIMNYTLLDYIANLNVKDRKNYPLFDAPDRLRHYRRDDFTSGFMQNMVYDNDVRIRNYTLGANIKQLSTESLPKQFDKKLESEIFKTLKTVLEKDIADQKINNAAQAWTSETLYEDLKNYKEILRDYRWSEERGSFEDISSAVIFDEIVPKGYFIHNKNGSVKRSIFAKVYLAWFYGRLFSRETKYLDPLFLNAQLLFQELQTNRTSFDTLLKKMNVSTVSGLISGSKAQDVSVSKSSLKQELPVFKDKSDPYYRKNFNEIFKDMRYTALRNKENTRVELYEKLYDAYDPAKKQYSSFYCATRLKELTAAFGGVFCIKREDEAAETLEEILLSSVSLKTMAAIYESFQKIHVPYKERYPHGYSVKFLTMLDNIYKGLTHYSEWDWVDRGKDSPFLSTKQAEYEAVGKLEKRSYKVVETIVKEYDKNARGYVEIPLKDGHPIILNELLLEFMKYAYEKLKDDGERNQELYLFDVNLERLQQQTVPKTYYDSPEDKELENMRMFRLIKEIVIKNHQAQFGSINDRWGFGTISLGKDLREYKEVLKNYTWSKSFSDLKRFVDEQRTSSDRTFNPRGYFELINKNRNDLSQETRNVFATLYLVALEQLLEGEGACFLKILSFLDALEKDENLFRNMELYAFPLEGESLGGNKK